MSRSNTTRQKRIIQIRLDAKRKEFSCCNRVPMSIAFEVFDFANCYSKTREDVSRNDTNQLDATTRER